ncbi:MAG: hypothetical protein WA705_00625 [Candidatus Ozemobacteraceae bacterium]
MIIGVFLKQFRINCFKTHNKNCIRVIAKWMVVDIFAFLFLIFPPAVFSQDMASEDYKIMKDNVMRITEKKNKYFSRNGVRLLKDYFLKEEYGIDCECGKLINEKTGFEIEYNGPGLTYPTIKPENRSEYIWFKEQIVKNETVWCALVQSKNSQEKVLHISYPKHLISFYAKVKNEEEISEVFLTALTFFDFAYEKIPTCPPFSK